MNKTRRINMTMRDVYRTSEVTRWHMVRVRREQSIAEHSFLVAMIAMRACELMKINDSLFIGYLIQKAMFHDLPEVYIGDIPTPVKRTLIGPHANKEIDWFESSVWFAGYSVTANHNMFADKVNDIIKLADTVEAIVFLDHHGEGPYALDAMAKLMNRAYERWPGIAETLVYEMTQGLIQSLESIYSET